MCKWTTVCEKRNVQCILWFDVLRYIIECYYYLIFDDALHQHHKLQPLESIQLNRLSVRVTTFEHCKLREAGIYCVAVALDCMQVLMFFRPLPCVIQC